MAKGTTFFFLLGHGTLYLPFPRSSHEHSTVRQTDFWYKAINVRSHTVHVMKYLAGTLTNHPVGSESFSSWYWYWYLVLVSVVPNMRSVGRFCQHADIDMTVGWHVGERFEKSSWSVSCATRKISNPVLIGCTTWPRPLELWMSQKSTI